MISRLWVNLALALAVVALAWLVFFKPEPAGPSKHKLSTLTPASIDEITIAPAQRPRVVLAKRAGNWFVTEPFAARADTARVDGLLGLLSAESGQRFAAQDLARFELDHPLARVTLGAQEFIFGGAHPLSNQLYVQTLGAVYLVSPVYFVDVAKQPTDYASKQLLDAGENPVAFEFATFKLTRTDGKWQKEPADTALSQDDANKFADEWRHAQALAVSQPRAFKATEYITLRFASGKTLKLQAAQQEQEWVLLREDEKLAYHFTLDAARRLRDLPLTPKK
ncbi:MAG: DUF4340 domain-containing protein [Hydrogenophilales bacterium]|nr:DUF4340 domain-containing protein [Hydrogenophilales bacterium]